jgi:hypothetical protein
MATHEEGKEQEEKDCADADVDFYVRACALGTECMPIFGRQNGSTVRPSTPSQ